MREQYNALAGQAVQLGLIRQEQATIEGYVTAKALDGLYLMIAEQEKAFRAESARRDERHREARVRRDALAQAVQASLREDHATRQTDGVA